MTLQDGQDEGKRTNVAVKLLYSNALMEDYKQELSMMTKLSHPNLIRLQHTSCTPDGHPAMILEFMRYGALDEWLMSRGLEVSDEDLLYMAHQVRLIYHAIVSHVR
jgi:serine/threonine protein kinase